MNDAHTRDCVSSSHPAPPFVHKPLRMTTCLLVCVFVAAVAESPTAQIASGRDTTAASVAAYPLSADMPVDPEVLIGGLPNGVRFYIRPNPRPARQAELRLVVKAGSVLEDDDQRGLAHFVEHMQFQGSRHFPGQSIDNFLSSIGLSIGSDANAVTSFDDTQYTLRVPTDRPGVLDTALTVLEDWAGGALFDDARSSGSARSCSRSGAAISAPTNVPPTSCGRCSSRARGTRTDRRSEIRPSSRPRSVNSWCASIATGTGPI